MSDLVELCECSVKSCVDYVCEGCGKPVNLQGAYWKQAEEIQRLQGELGEAVLDILARDRELSELQEQLSRYKWVSVEDRLPEFGRYVWANYGLGQAECFCQEPGIWRIRHNWAVTPDVTHWMPLPPIQEPEE